MLWLGKKCFYSCEVEEIILEIKGISDKDSSEVVCAHVVLENNYKKNRDSMKTKINKYTHEKLAAYKNPKKIVFHKDLPKNNIGKVLKKDLG